jgi:hypothetical protein
MFMKWLEMWFRELKLRENLENLLCTASDDLQDSTRNNSVACLVKRSRELVPSGT